jgi:hypothetical protein
MLKSSRATSRVTVELKTNISQTSAVDVDIDPDNGDGGGLWDAVF